MKSKESLVRFVLAAIGLLQILAALRTLLRFLQAPTILPLCAVEPGVAADITIVVPVLNEALRLEPLLACLGNVEYDVAQILIVDGGSTDGTPELVARFAARNTRMRVIDAGAPPADWNGKAWNMQRGLDEAATPYVLFLDADVTISAFVPSSLRAALRKECVAALSIAAAQNMPGNAALALHAALLATYVYRNGRPGRRATVLADAAANGQVFFCETAALRNTRAIEQARFSRCEDLTIVHALLSAGYATAFVEMPCGVSVSMYASWREVALNWPRSLVLADHFNRGGASARLADIVLLQALPPLAAMLRPPSRSFRRLNALLFMMRCGVLAGTARVYEKCTLGYWLSPLADFPAVCLILAFAAAPNVRWRGRTLARENRN